MNRRDCLILMSSGREPTLSVTDLVQREVQTSAPRLAWAEPDPLQVDLGINTGGRREFCPLLIGAPDWDPDLRLVEARLFWPNAALHMVQASDASGCRWSRLEEVTDGADATAVVREEFSVYGRQDLARFGLAGLDGLAHTKSLRAVTYQRNGRLLGWRLLDSVEGEGRG